MALISSRPMRPAAPVTAIFMVPRSLQSWRDGQALDVMLGNQPTNEVGAFDVLYKLPEPGGGFRIALRRADRLLHGRELAGRMRAPGMLLTSS